MTQKRAYSLIELITVMAVMPLVLLVIGRLYTGLIMEIPRSFHAVTENTAVVRMADQLQQDIDQALDLPQAYGPWIQDANTLLIQWPDNTIRYHRDKGVMIRYTSLTGNDPNGLVAGRWTMPNAVIDWYIQRQDGRALTLTMQSYIKRTIWHDVKKKMANSYVFYPGTFAGAVPRHDQ